MNINWKNKPKVLVLFGPTAVGKTEIISKIPYTQCEVINADSMQVYRGIDIGTAKPSSSVLEKTPHHLIDICEPEEQYNVGMFVRQADTLIPNIHSRGKLPIISGGTAFYLIHFLFGLPDAPRSDKKIREYLYKKLDEFGEEHLYRELEKVDPVSAQKTNVRDTKRVIRALEVFISTGSPLSEFAVPRNLRENYHFCIIGLYRERQELYKRINERVEEMFRQGIVDEIKVLLSKGFTFNDPGLKAIGYQEFGMMQEAGCLQYGDIKEYIKRNSRRYAKRQYTFFKRIPYVLWFHPSQSDDIKHYITHC